MLKRTVAKGLLAGGFIACLSFASASAQDPQSYRAPFDGTYLGAFLSTGVFDAYRADDDGYLTDNAAWTARDFGVGGGLQLGHDWQSGSSVLGLVGDFTFLNSEATTINDPNGGPTIVRSEMNWMSTLRGRAGLASDDLLVYLTGGVAVADVDTLIQDAAPHSFSETRFGLSGGAGAEIAIAGNWTLGGEMLYTRFSEYSLNFTEPPDNFRFEAADSLLLAKLALNYRFGGPSAPAPEAPRGGAFDGTYLGAFLSAGVFDAHRQDNDGYMTDNSSWMARDFSGGAGLQLGHDWQRGRRVLGLVGDFNWLNSEATSTDEPNNPGSNIVRSELNWMSTLRGRAGITGDDLLLYVTGGAAVADIDTLIQDTAPHSFSETRFGLVGGAGAEIALAGNWNLGGELLVTQFTEDSLTFVEGIDTFRFDAADTVGTAKVSLNYRFGGPRNATPNAANGGPFDGCYVGAALAAGVFDAYRADADGYLTDNASWKARDFTAGAGLHVGHDWQKGRRVLGLVADFNWLNAEAQSINQPNVPPSGLINSELNWMSTLRGRAGVTSDNLLVFLTAGVAVADSDTLIQEAAPHSFSETRFGLTGGAGVEFALSNNWSIGGEVLYTKFSEQNLNFVEGGNFRFDAADSLILTKASLNYRF